MANLILDETFTNAPIGGFGTLYAQGGTPTVTHNPTYSSMDLVQALGNHAAWVLTSQPFQTTGEFEIDIELVTDFTGSRKHLGIWLVAQGGTPPTPAISFDHLDTSWYATPWPISIGSAGANYFVNLETANAIGTNMSYTQGSRKLFSVSWAPTSTDNTKSAIEFRIDGSIVGYIPYNPYSQGYRPGIHFYSVTLARLHGVKLWDSPRVPLQTLFPRSTTSYNTILPRIPGGTNAPYTYILNNSIAILSKLLGTGTIVTYSNNISLIGSYKPGQAGTGIIQGTVAQYTGPVSTRVFLFTTSMLLISETISNATTGSYTFYNVDPLQKYVVVAMDYSGTYNAVIADRLTPT